MITKIIGLIICFLLQASCRNYLIIFGVAPDFLILGLVLAVGKKNLLEGILLGAGCGVVYDLLSYGAFGTGIFSFTLAGFVIAFLKKQVFSDNVISGVLIALIVTLLNSLLALLLVNFFYIGIDLLGELLRVALPVSIYTSLLLFLVVTIYYLSKGNVKKAFG